MTPVQYHSQPATRQDEWVVQKTGGYAGGYFVEIGAHNGVRHSNTKALEDHFGWKGLLVEPNPVLFEALRYNRPNCKLAREVIGPYANLDVSFVVGQGDSAAFSGLKEFMPPEWFENHCRHKSKIEQVCTMTLASLFTTQGVPKQIDYLSLDVKGAEWAILESYLAGTTRYNHTIDYLTVEFRYDRLLLDELERLLEPTHVLDEVRAFDACFVNRRLV